MQEETNKRTMRYIKMRRMGWDERKWMDDRRDKKCRKYGKIM